MKKITYKQALETLTTPEEWLEYYSLFFGEFWVQTQDKKFWSKWYSYPTEGYPFGVNARQIMPIEIVFDVDCANSQRASFVGRTIIPTILKRRGFNFSCYKSGGDGYHNHLFIPSLQSYNDEEREYVKREFINWISRDRGYACQSGVYSKRLISLECSKHRKGRIKQLVDYFFIDGKINEIPKEVMDLAIGKYNKEKAMEFIDDGITLESKSKMKCIKFIESGNLPKQLKDFRRRAGFLYAAFMIKNHSNGYIANKIMKYLNLNKDESDKIVKYINPKRHMTCSGRRKFLIDANIGNLCDGCMFNVTKK